MTPVALMTGPSRAAATASARARADAGSPAAMAARAASTSSGWGRPTSTRPRASASTEGGRSEGIATHDRAATGPGSPQRAKLGRLDWNLDPIRVAKAVATFLVVAILIPLVTAGTALASIVYLPLPAPPLPTPAPGVESRITHIYDATGKEIGILRKFDTSIPVKASDIPDVLKQAVVAVEDKRFYSHGGIDPVGAIRALWADLRGKRVVQGGSTITQQYVKNVYTSGERTLARKIREAVLASQLDCKVTRTRFSTATCRTSIWAGGPTASVR